MNAARLSWPKHPDGRAKMVCELSPAEFNLQRSVVVAAIVARLPSGQRQIAFGTPGAAESIQASATALMLMRNAALAARWMVKP